MVFLSRIVFLVRAIVPATVVFVVGGLSCIESSRADVNFSVNATQGVHSISPYIYGANQFNTSTPPVNSAARHRFTTCSAPLPAVTKPSHTAEPFASTAQY